MDIFYWQPLNSRATENYRFLIKNADRNFDFQETQIKKRIDTGVVHDSQPKPIRKTLLADFLPGEARKCKLVDESAEQ